MHYGRAAKRMGLTQSGLSRCIQSAEREAKATLFDRNRSKLKITDAGRSYVEHARISLAHGERAMHSAIEVDRGTEAILRIGKSPDVDPVLVDILYSIRLPLFPTLEINVISEASGDLAYGLMSADLDVALITQPEQYAKLTMNKLAETPLHVVLPRDHSLALKDGVNLADFRDESWIIYQRKTHPLLYERILNRMQAEDIHPKRIDRILYPDEAEHLLVAQRGVAFLTKAHALRLSSDRLVAKPLNEDTLCLDEWIAARANDESRLVSEFVRAFVTRSVAVLQPSQMVLPIEKDGSPSSQCSPS
jgi:DNA-binding transcriptional LysR family regulator